MKQWEKDIFNRHWPGLVAITGLGERLVQKLVADFLKESVRESKQDGTFYLPLNYGNILLKEEKEGSKSLVPEREEGVTDEDILWYYNMHEVERRVLDKIDIYHRLAMYEQYTSDGLIENQALKKLFKFRPRWGNPKDTKYATGDDRSLPPSLMDRVNRYIMKRSESDINKFKLDCEQLSSFNALIRKEIKRGKV